ncbi:MAG TPA: hypothetical protein VMW27_18105 [Thermoanaerobaculia bacterium]|nr:hypothetical protein [Thermoanaerobaculia bacterium]
MSDTLTAQDLRPDNDTLLEATLMVLKGRVDEDEVRRFVEKASNNVTAPVLGAEVTLKLAVYGNLKCNPTTVPYKSYLYDNTVWGGPAYFGTSVGFLYTAYESWETFFRNVTGVHVQGVAAPVGALQVNFLENGLLIGQFNGPAGRVGLVQAGGKGMWERK